MLGNSSAHHRGMIDRLFSPVMLLLFPWFFDAERFNLDSCVFAWNNSFVGSAKYYMCDGDVCGSLASCPENRMDIIYFGYTSAPF